MAIGKEIETRSHIIGFKEELDKTIRSSEDKFFTWFDSAQDKEQAYLRGNWDFATHVLNPIKHLVQRPENMTICEIGHGAGRLLASASRFFGKAMGVDIHNHNQQVLEEFHRLGVDNTILFQSDGEQLPIDNNSVDIFYSFIVFQHLERLKILENYLNEIFSKLKKGGIAVIYFGRDAKYSQNKSSKLLLLVDLVTERMRLKQGFQEIPSRVNEVNLKLTLAYCKKLAKKHGFQVVKSLVSRKKVPDGLNLYGGQHGLVLRKK